MTEIQNIDTIRTISRLTFCYLNIRTLIQYVAVFKMPTLFCFITATKIFKNDLFSSFSKIFTCMTVSFHYEGRFGPIKTSLTLSLSIEVPVQKQESQLS